QPLLRVSEAPPARAENLQEIGFSLDLASPAHDLWPYVSDTDRMNQIVGLPPVRVERTRLDGEAATFLSNVVLGLSLRWREYPFEGWGGGGGGVVRVLEGGLLRWSRVRLELEPLASGGTRLHYTMQFEPRYRLLAFLVRFEVGVKQKARLLKMFER